MKSRSALHFVLIIGIANFFADFTYEGARAIVGPFLGSLGASAAIVGFVAGFGELMGYGLRSVSGYLADKSHRHWAFAFAGYALNMFAVPALALATRWPLASGLVVSERIGRGIRKPTVEAMLSYAGKSIGAGWVFGLNEALDQAGATIGPLLMALILYLNGGFRTGFGVLLIPALLCLATLAAARLLHPRPHELEEGTGHTFTTTNLTRAYWIYLAAGALLAAGFADFALIGFHFHKTNTVSANLIPVFYAVAMASSALASIPLGRLFDRFGPNISLFAFVISAAAAPFVFLGTSTAALIGMVFWGVGMSAQGSLFQAMLTGVIPPQKRSTAFGLFDTGYGIAWFVGSAVMGLLYDKSILAVALFSVSLQLAALPLFFIANKQR
ncbi:MAG TPA: MFS transporter [Candidatus Limnocylindria bacterium]|jgi:MFS family permease|nr:MFS transporter [Candidatus Limnocylindria bacterium]